MHASCAGIHDGICVLCMPAMWSMGMGWPHACMLGDACMHVPCIQLACCVCGMHVHHTLLGLCLFLSLPTCMRATAGHACMHACACGPRMACMRRAPHACRGSISWGQDPVFLHATHACINPHPCICMHPHPHPHPHPFTSLLRTVPWRAHEPL
jgi:hypothetical protein